MRSLEWHRDYRKKEGRVTGSVITALWPRVSAIERGDRTNVVCVPF